jgi:hypothetical protein
LLWLNSFKGQVKASAPHFVLREAARRQSGTGRDGHFLARAGFRSLRAELGHSQIQNRPLTKKAPPDLGLRGGASQSGSSGVLGGTPSEKIPPDSPGTSPDLEFNVCAVPNTQMLVAAAHRQPTSKSCRSRPLGTTARRPQLTSSPRAGAVSFGGTGLFRPPVAQFENQSGLFRRAKRLVVDFMTTRARSPRNGRLEREA